MKKVIACMLITSIFVHSAPILAKTINQADTNLCETLKYTLINSLRKTIDEAVEKIYEDDKNAPEGLTWASYDTEVLKIRQMNGIGGTYEITLKVKPYYRAHIAYGEDMIVVDSDGHLLSYKHLKTYPKVQF
jgi:hypothetical protein